MHLYHKEIAGMFIVERFVPFGNAAPTFHALAMQVWLRRCDSDPTAYAWRIFAANRYPRCACHPEPLLHKGHAIHAPIRYLSYIYNILITKLSTCSLSLVRPRGQGNFKYLVMLRISPSVAY